MRQKLKDSRRIVIKIGSSSIQHSETGKPDLVKIETLVRELSDLHNQGKDVVLVSSGAVMMGRDALGLNRFAGKAEGKDPGSVSHGGTLIEKQACASVGQARLMMLYQKLFSEYNQICSQILMTKNTMLDNLNRINTRNTFNELLSHGVIPIVNENDTIATYELDLFSVFGDNDHLSAVVAALIEADLLILLSDIDGFYTDDPHRNPDARFIDTVEKLDEAIMHMGKGSTGSSVGSGGMATKLSAAKVASMAGVNMVIASGKDFRILHRIMGGESVGTLFLPDKKDEFYLLNYLEQME
ncbi:MAG: glutamate 5-kinase [Eubacterium sp.]|nr:glutamate 5-kinase [Eubacterium sp.]